MASVSVSFQDVELAGQWFRALGCGALYWPAEAMLLVADLHLEKGSHFAARGWMLPPHDSLETLRRLEAAALATGARRVAALGDSFHDVDGPERLEPAARAVLARLVSGLDWLWVTGNHDGGSGAALGGRVVDAFSLCGVALRHEALPGFAGAEISGHFHPKVRVPLRSGRSVARRCLARVADRLVLPAYGAYAGGLFVDDPAFRAALGAVPEALVPTSGGLIRLMPTCRSDAA
jgi:DNA ligase-associated metallophosphoesterase